ncbi:PIG-L deacetylase family protein [Arthrobacter sp. 179]|uniref:PIG-L deacetylase family protein n=1 Tax=Arthrobacter sp. 179 TaxID=3457734 RepID=UPI0040342C24
MLLFVIGASLAGVIAIQAFSGSGSRWLVRNFHQNHRHRITIASLAACVFAVNLWCLFFPIGAAIGEVVIGVTLVLFAGLIVWLYRSAASPDRTPNQAQTVLAVGAHPDDLELACGGTLAKLVDSGYEVHALIMSHGQVGGDKARRPSEALAGSNYLGLSSLDVLDLPDTYLSQHNMEMVEAIEEKIKSLGPVIVFTHSSHDHHQDHHAVHLATLRAARRHPSILCFESPSTTRGFNPSIYVDIDAYVDIKVQAVQLHRNQNGKPYMSADRVRGVASFRGSQAKREFAEGFEPVRLLASTPGASL